MPCLLPRAILRQIGIIIRKDIWKVSMDKERAMIEKNIELGAEFSRYLFEHDDMGDKIPFGSEVILLPEFDEELKKYNLSIGKQLEDEGSKVLYITIKKLRPKTLSRLEDVCFESVV